MYTSLCIHINIYTSNITIKFLNMKNQLGMLKISHMYERLLNLSNVLLIACTLLHCTTALVPLQFTTTLHSTTVFTESSPRTIQYISQNVCLSVVCAIGRDPEPFELVTSGKELIANITKLTTPLVF